MTVLYHHRGNLDELLKLDRWWRQVKCADWLVVKLDEDDPDLGEVADNFKAGAFLPHWEVFIGPRTDDALDLSHELYMVMGLEQARDLVLVTSDPTRIALYLLAYRGDEEDFDEH